ncbi:hypothetical protein GOV07_00505 [Candidatus Woesearchaeota archaeon]|nr:hypothetical protein [Candidatus Woesearchaeota archaeon]
MKIILTLLIVMVLALAACSTSEPAPEEAENLLPPQMDAKPSLMGGCGGMKTVLSDKQGENSIALVRFETDPVGSDLDVDAAVISVEKGGDLTWTAYKAVITLVKAQNLGQKFTREVAIGRELGPSGNCFNAKIPLAGWTAKHPEDDYVATVALMQGGQTLARATSTAPMSAFTG